MSKFVVSARKYRPAKFDEVVGQQHVSQTLKNALKNEQLAHAFLFCGPRGVGKTTCARILAKVINCSNVTPEFEACNECSSCKSFNENASFNIHELDAASNNSVDHIRALVEQVRFQPQQGKYKIYIIDEVHMLSQAAFNAFLKTLEEPPPYAIFILATTEKHKIIPTILSRCQIFDFYRIQVPAIMEHLQHICKQEAIETDNDALRIVAQKADGALRDALSIFDRLVSFSGKSLSYDDVITNLNILDYDYYFKIVDAMLMEDLPTVMNIFDDILSKGFESDIFINGFAGHLRNLLVCKDTKTLKLLEVGETIKERYASQASLSTKSFLLTALSLANDCDVHYKMARNKRLHVEMAIIKMTYINRAIKLSGTTSLEKKTPEPTLNIDSPSTDVINHVSPSSTPKEEPAITASQVETATPAKQTTSSGIVMINSTSTEQSIKPTTQEPPNEGEGDHSKNTSLLENSPSIKSLSSLMSEVEEEAHIKETTETTLTQIALKAAWKKFTAQIESPSVRTRFETMKLKIEEEKITVIVGSQVAKGSVQSEQELMPFLRKELGSDNLLMDIQIDLSMQPKVERPKTPKMLTDKEKFFALREANPLVDDIRKKFDLGLDH